MGENLARLLRGASSDVLCLNPDLAVEEGKRAKYGNTAVEVDGIRFQSKKEAERYGVLRDLERAGQIAELEIQPVFVLQEGFTDNRGKRWAGILYYADFAYVDVRTGDWVVEDVKSKVTRDLRAFNLKWKLLLYKFRYDKRIRFEIVE